MQHTHSVASTPRVTLRSACVYRNRYYSLGDLRCAVTFIRDTGSFRLTSEKKKMLARFSLALKVWITSVAEHTHTLTHTHTHTHTHTPHNTHTTHTHTHTHTHTRHNYTHTRHHTHTHTPTHTHRVTHTEGITHSPDHGTLDLGLHAFIDIACRFPLTFPVRVEIFID